MRFRGTNRNTKTRKIKVYCSCGLTWVKMAWPNGTCKGTCAVCGDFGFYPRLYNARFQGDYMSRSDKRKQWF